MIGVCSTASFGSCVQAHHGAICRFAMAHAFQGYSGVICCSIRLNEFPLKFLIRKFELAAVDDVSSRPIQVSG
jgi:hypothetical protein